MYPLVRCGSGHMSVDSLDPGVPGNGTVDSVWIYSSTTTKCLGKLDFVPRLWSGGNPQVNADVGDCRSQLQLMSTHFANLCNQIQAEEFFAHLCTSVVPLLSRYHKSGLGIWRFVLTWCLHSLVPVQTSKFGSFLNVSEKHAYNIIQHHKSSYNWLKIVLLLYGTLKCSSTMTVPIFSRLPTTHAFAFHLPPSSTWGLAAWAHQTSFQLTMKISHLGSLCVVWWGAVTVPSAVIQARVLKQLWVFFFPMCRAIQRPDLSQIGRDIQTQNPQVKSTCGRIMVESLETEYPEGIQNTEAGAVLLSARSHEVHHQFLFKQRMILISSSLNVQWCAMCHIMSHLHLPLMSGLVPHRRSCRPISHLCIQGLINRNTSQWVQSIYWAQHLAVETSRAKMCQICSFLHLRFVHLCTVVRVAFGGHFDMKRPRLPDAAGQAVRLVLNSKLQFECLEHLGTGIENCPFNQNTSTTQVQQASLCCTFSWLVDKTCSCYINVPRQRIELSHDCWMALYLRELGGSKQDSWALQFNLHSSLRSCCKHKHITETLLKHLTVSFSLMKGPASYHGSSQDESQSSKSSGILGIEQVPALESDSRIVIIAKESKCLMKVQTNKSLRHDAGVEASHISGPGQCSSGDSQQMRCSSITLAVSLKRIGKRIPKKIKIASYCFWTFHNDLKKELTHLLRSKIIWYK